MSHIEELREMIHRLHGGMATHKESVPVKEVFNGQTVWDGIVEVFSLEGHPTANTAYAWLHAAGDSGLPAKSVTVLHVPPVVSPVTAVRAFIIQEFASNAIAKA
jgi:hypothetical protein